jgi:hypothetical protein
MTIVGKDAFSYATYFVFIKVPEKNERTINNALER